MASRVVEVETVPTRKSMTMWVNGISAAVFVLGLITGPDMLMGLGMPAAWADRAWLWMGLLLAAGNAWLRKYRTKAPLEGSPPAKQARRVVAVRQGDL